jgi:4-hydroxybenzoate polyprenyltransferase
MSPKKKIIVLFIIATSSLLFAGNILNPNQSLSQILTLQWCGICGTILVYYYDGFFNEMVTYPTFLIALSKDQIRAIFIFQFLFITIPLSLYVLPINSIAVLCFICLFAIIYTIKIPINGNSYQFKKIFLLKNILIGFNWGALILVGAGTFNKTVNALFLFTSFQILIGSIVRDINDAEKDKIAGLKTVPIILNIKNTLIALHIANILTVLCGCLDSWNHPFVLLTLIIIIWKAIIIWHAGKNNVSTFWCQTLNILICFGIFIILAIQYLYESN